MTASIQLMTVYGELPKLVAQTVDQFSRGSINLDNARDGPIERFSRQLDGDESGADDQGGSPRMTLFAEDLAGVFASLDETPQRQQPFTGIFAPDQVLRLVTSARPGMARSRHRLLASMVLLGINRIVVRSGPSAGCRCKRISTSMGSVNRSAT